MPAARVRASLLALFTLVVLLAGATQALAATHSRAKVRARVAACRTHHGHHCARRAHAALDSHATITLTGEPTASTQSTTATFAWKFSDSDRRSHCSLDGGAWALCESGEAYTGLATGSHSFAVRLGGEHAVASASDSWTVTAAPSTPSAPSTPTAPPTAATPSTPTTPTTAPTTPTTPATPTTPTNPTTPTTPTSAPTAPPAGGSASGTMANSFGSDLTGVAAGGTIQNEDPTTLAADLSLDQSAGSKWLRIDINWAQIQNGGPNSYDWSNIDAVVEGAEAHGMSVLGTIVYTPGWARPANTSATYAPNPSQYAAFAAAAVAHYSQLGVQDYEIWNEPNQVGAFTPAPNASTYTSMLTASYRSIKSVDPSATVITGGLSPATNDGTNIAPVTFLQDIYADGGQGSFDAVGMHPYCNPDMPGDTDAWSAWYQMYGTPTSLRSVMVANGDGAKKIWGTEFGAPSAGITGVSQAFQAQTVTMAFQLWSTYSWAGPLFFYQGRDSGSDSTNAYDNYGFATTNFTLKQSFYAYQQAAAAL